MEKRSGVKTSSISDNDPPQGLLASCRTMRQYISVVEIPQSVYVLGSPSTLPLPCRHHRCLPWKTATACTCFPAGPLRPGGRSNDYLRCLRTLGATENALPSVLIQPPTPHTASEHWKFSECHM
uniref:Uncharacterized protein n=1 Tax=Molossus molossus TaxID=27622 RepID=A0A7J8F9V6_MOLMO|nr:hypothetical protein HJG59_008474 [Molossus molossus]